jgi:hypothetical protein
LETAAAEHSKYDYEQDGKANSRPYQRVEHGAQQAEFAIWINAQFCGQYSAGPKKCAADFV